MDKHLEIANELKQILCGQHADWTGDSINDASAFLRELKRAYPGVANAMAGDLDRNIDDFVTMTELDHHTLMMAAKVLSGKAFSLDYMEDRRTPRTMIEAFGKSPASISGPYKRTYDLPLLTFIAMSLFTVAAVAVIAW